MPDRRTDADRRPTGPSLGRILLSPRSIALVGASEDASKTTGRPLKFLRQAGFEQKIYPINPRRDTVQGEKAWPDLASLPEVPEQVFVLTGTDSVLPIFEECAALGVGVVTVLASGFSEAGAEGAALEARLRAAARRSMTRLLGPSSLGIVDLRNRLTLTANAAFAEPELPPGRVFVASHSGSMIGALVSRGKARGVGFAGLVSVGGEADLCIGEIASATLDDSGIDGYLLFLESLRHGAELRRFALEAARRGKPIIAYKLGRSAAAAEMATTHTGALAGEDDVADAFMRDLGIARVGIIEALLECAPLAARIPLAALAARGSAPLRVGVVTTTGGGAAMAVDQLGIRGIDVVGASAALLQRLRAANVPATAGRVLDLTLAGTRYEVMKAAIEGFKASGEFDLVLVVVGSSARFNPDLAVRPIIDCAQEGSTPLAAMLVPAAPTALAMLTSAAVPCFQQPEACADAIAAVWRRRAPSDALAHSAMADHTNPGSTVVVTSTLSEAQGYELFDRIGMPHAPFVLASLPDAPGAGGSDRDNGGVTALPFGFPVVAKICSAQIPHKTEVDGVVLGIANHDELRTALGALHSRLATRAPGIHCEEALIQPMCEGLGEVLLGYRVDSDAGPIVMLAAGGTWAELLQDRSIRLAPVTLDAAREMIDEVRMLQGLRGFRGKQRGDLSALAQAIVALSGLASRPELGVIEAEANPVLVLPEGKGVLALDALVRVVG